MSKRKLRHLREHILSLTKTNLMCDETGRDTYICENCGKGVKLVWPMRTVAGDCAVPLDQYEAAKSRLEEGKRRKRVKGETVGCWGAIGHPGTCHKCGAPLVDCPREGHPNSRYWALERDDGMTLYVCPNDCPF